MSKDIVSLDGLVKKIAWKELQGWDMLPKCCLCTPKWRLKMKYKLSLSWVGVHSKQEDLITENANSGNSQTPQLKDNTKLSLLTTFNNESDAEQVHNLRVETSSKSTLKISIVKGVTIGGEVPLTLKLPVPFLEFGLKTSFSNQSTNTREQIFEAETKWSGECQLRVPVGTCTTATIKTNTKSYTKHFQLSTAFGGAVVACFTRKRDGTVYKSFPFEVEDIFVDENKTKLPMIVEGYCHCQYEGEQQIDIKHVKKPTQRQDQAQQFPSNENLGIVA